MKDYTIDNEILFNSVEKELERRWAVTHIPYNFARRPVDHTKIMVRAWWELYHETTCAAWRQNRRIWDRHRSAPARPLDTSELAMSLSRIRSLIVPEALEPFRVVTRSEWAAIRLLEFFVGYYTDDSIREPVT